MKRDDNDRLRDGEELDPMEGLILDGADPAEPPPPDDLPGSGLPLLVKVPGAAVWHLRTSDGTYAPVDQGLVRSELERNHPEIETWDDAGKKPRPMSAPELYDRYGIRAERVFYTYQGRSRFVRRAEHSGDLYCVTGVDEPPPPVLHHEVLDWLRVLCGRSFDRVLDWLATVPILTEPTAAIVLLGDNSLGKGMFAHGVSRYFGNSLTTYDDVFKERFNDALLRNPVIYLDEGSAVAAGSFQFRRMIGNRVHSIEEKGRPSATLLGCPRMIVAANGPDPLRLSKEDLTRADEDAIGKRLILVDCDPDTGGYLTMRGGARYTADWVTRPDGSPGKIPETIAWLAAYRPVQPGDRFLVPGDAGEWAARIGTREGLPATVLYAIATYRESAAIRSQIEQDGPPYPCWWRPEQRPGAVLVSNEGLRRHWVALTGEARAPSHTTISRALDRVAPQGRERIALEPGYRPWLYAVKEEILPA